VTEAGSAANATPGVDIMETNVSTPAVSEATDINYNTTMVTQPYTNTSRNGSMATENPGTGGSTVPGKGTTVSGTGTAAPEAGTGFMAFGKGTTLLGKGTTVPKTGTTEPGTSSMTTSGRASENDVSKLRE